MSSQKSLKILMVCLGNICRSPTAHGVLSALIKRRKLCDYLEVDSAGTGCWHLGEKPDRRSISAAQVRGYDLCALIARQVKIIDFADFDYILAMDSDNLRDLDKICPDEYKDKLDLLKIFQISIQFLICSCFSLRIYFLTLDLKKELRSSKLQQPKQELQQFE